MDLPSQMELLEQRILAGTRPPMVGRQAINRAAAATLRVATGGACIGTTDCSRRHTLITKVTSWKWVNSNSANWQGKYEGVKEQKVILADGWTAELSLNSRGQIVSIHYTLRTIASDGFVYGYEHMEYIDGQGEPISRIDIGSEAYHPLDLPLGPMNGPAEKAAHAEFIRAALYGTDDPMMNWAFDLEWHMFGREAFPNGRYGRRLPR